MQPSESNAEFVMVPIPVSLYPSVIRLIADFQATTTHRVPRLAPTSEAPTGGSAPAVRQAGEGIDKWSKSDFETLLAYVNPFSRAVLDLCSRAPDQWILYRDAVAKSGIKTASARSQLGGLTKLVNRLFPQDDWRGWPFEYDVEPGEERQLRLRLDKESARLWTEVSRGGDRS